MISIHASRGGSDPERTAQETMEPTFQSTLPAGEATVPKRHGVAGGHISIHASRGGSDLGEDGKVVGLDISIHASRGGSDRR